jgi:hypothetical protein
VIVVGRIYSVHAPCTSKVILSHSVLLFIVGLWFTCFQRHKLLTLHQEQLKAYMAAGRAALLEWAEMVNLPDVGEGVDLSSYKGLCKAFAEENLPLWRVDPKVAYQRIEERATEIFNTKKSSSQKDDEERVEGKEGGGEEEDGEVEEGEEGEDDEEEDEDGEIEEGEEEETTSTPAAMEKKKELLAKKPLSAAPKTNKSPAVGIKKRVPAKANAGVPNKKKAQPSNRGRRGRGRTGRGGAASSSSK